jgi:AbrB family looped-hinge helix DNA binding protein
LPKKGKITMETILDRFGRIVIPKKIREDFNLKAGTQIQIEENEKSIILTPVHGEPSLRIKDGVLVFSGVPLEDLGESLTKHRQERLKTIRKTNENLI